MIQRESSMKQLLVQKLKTASSSRLRTQQLYETFPLLHGKNNRMIKENKPAKSMRKEMLFQNQTTRLRLRANISDTAIKYMIIKIERTVVENKFYQI